MTIMDTCSNLDKTSTNKQRLSWKNWLPVFAFITIAIAIRLYRTSTADFYLLAGSDGPYFPLQVKYLIEYSKMAFPDMPLVFLLGAVFVKILHVLHVGSLQDCILLSVRWMDAFLPPLAAIPVFLLGKELTNSSGKLKWTTLVVVAYSVLNFTVLFIFSYQLQKNGIAVPIVFLYLYYLVRFIKDQQKPDLFKALMALCLCVITHFGSFVLLLFLTSIFYLFWLLFYQGQRQFRSPKIFLPVAAVLIAVLSIIALFDAERFARLIKSPLKLFEAPVLFFAMRGQNYVLHGPNLVILITTNVLAIFGIFLLVRNRAEIEKYKLTIGIGSAFCAIFLSNPLLGLEWANRLFITAFVPLTILYLVILNVAFSKAIQTFLAFVFILLMMMSFSFAIFLKPFLSISGESFAEFKQLHQQIDFEPGDAVVARQDLRLLANWSFQIKSFPDYLLTKNEYRKYQAVYFIQQIKGKNPGVRETRKPIPDKYSQVFSGEYFIVYKITSDSDLPNKPQKIFKGIRGTVVENSLHKLVVKDYRTEMIRTVSLKNSYPGIKKGMKIEVNGEWTAFSLDIRAETIKELNAFE